MVTGTRLLYGVDGKKGCRDCWSETPSDRIVDGNGTLCIRSGGSVAGSRGCLAKFGVARSKFVLLT